MNKADRENRISFIILKRSERFTLEEIADMLGIRKDTLAEFIDRWNVREIAGYYPEPEAIVIEKPAFVSCPVCGDQFPNVRGRVYCGDKCKCKAAYQRENPETEKNCKWCGAAYSTRSREKSEYCSRRCSKAAYNAAKKFSRSSQRERLLKCTEIDKKVTLPVLIKRDRNTCALCGEPCDLYDYDITENGVVVAGERYPSIDHIVPISRGGDHVWTNVQLAHRGCNRKKGAEL